MPEQVRFFLLAPDDCHGPFWTPCELCDWQSRQRRSLIWALRDLCRHYLRVHRLADPWPWLT